MKQTVEKVKNLFKRALPRSKSFYVLFVVNLITIVSHMIEKEYVVAGWVVGTTIWIWLYFSTLDDMTRLMDLLDDSIASNNNNLGEINRLLDFLGKKGLIKKKDPKKAILN